MKLSLAFILALALTMSPFGGHGPGYVSRLSWVWNWDQKLDVPEEQHPVGTKSQTSTWPCWFGLTTCPDRTEERKTIPVLPEEQHPVGTRSQTATWLCWIGLDSCPDRTEGKKKNQLLPEEQHLVRTKSQTSFWPCWFGLTSCSDRIEERKGNQLLPEEEHPVETKILTSTWPCWLGLASCPDRTEGKKTNKLLPEEQRTEETKCQTSTWPCWFGLTSCPIRIEERKGNQLLPEEEHPVETKSQTSTWLCWIGLASCPDRTEGRKTNPVLPEEQHLVRTKSQTSTWPCWFGLTSCSDRIEERKRNQVLPEEQHPVGTKSQTSTWLCWFRLTSCPDRTEGRKTKQLLPEEQHPVGTKILTSYWPCWLGPSQCPRWVWYKGSKVVPEGPKQPSPGTKQKAYGLPAILVYLWDYLVQRRAWLLTESLIDICILCLHWTACSLWRRLRRPWAEALPAPEEDPIKHLLGPNAGTSQKNEPACFYPPLACKSEKGKTGLINMGNTCYVNSVIQALFMASDFRHSVLNLSGGISQPLMTELRSLFALLEHSQRPAVSPDSFLSASRPPWFTPGAQQDCSEYLKYLLNRLHEEEKTGKSIYYQKLTESSLMSQARERHSFNKTLIEKMFGGKMVTKIRCLKCLNISSREEAFTDLSLAFPPPDRPVWRPRSTSVDTTKHPHLAFGKQTRAPKDSRSVSDLINYFLSPERLTAGNQYHCEKCASLQDAEKVTELAEGPHYLILTLLRFSFDPQTMKRIKILDSVSIPAVLELPILVSPEETEDICWHGKDTADLGSTFVPAVYDLCSVVVHSGITSQSGHYYCFSRECTDTGPQAPPRDGTPKRASGKQLDSEIPWYFFNDATVSTHSFESVSKLASLYPKDTAYVLFYRQREGSL